jgi:hypothetical protein
MKEEKREREKKKKRYPRKKTTSTCCRLIDIDYGVEKTNVRLVHIGKKTFDNIDVLTISVANA